MEKGQTFETISLVIKQSWKAEANAFALCSCSALAASSFSTLFQ